MKYLWISQSVYHENLDTMLNNVTDAGAEIFSVVFESPVTVLVIYKIERKEAQNGRKNKKA